ncbi:MAG: hypothetical protein HQ539_02810 [Parcubacteria group bacterium]|nr:hypothetical protein [Parcubacteria group bacterium]
MAVLLTLISLLFIPFIWICFSIYYFIIRKNSDAQRIDSPINQSFKEIYLKNFKPEDFAFPPSHRYIVVPKSGLKRRAYNTGSMILEAVPFLPKKYTDFETIIVDDVNSTKQIKEAVYKDLRLEVIPTKIFKNLPINWREYISWKLLSENPPRGYENVIIQKERELNLNEEDLKTFKIITNPKNMYNYLDAIYPQKTKREFDFLREGVYRIAKVIENPEIFNWIFRNIKSKNLNIIQVLLDSKIMSYVTIFKRERAVLAYNMIPSFFDLMMKLEDQLNNLKIEHNTYASTSTSFASITKGFTG